MSQDWIEREIIIEASRERVWSVLTDAHHIARWFGDSAEIDLRPGGHASFGWKDDGTYLAVVEHVDEPNVLSYRWARGVDEKPAEGTSTLVEFTLTEVPLGTLLRVVETGFASLHGTEAAQERAANENTEGWAQELAELKDYAERQAA